MKNILMLSAMKIYQGNSAGSARMLNIAKSLALSANNVYMCSAVLSRNLRNVSEVLPNIFLVGEEEEAKKGGGLLINFCRRVGFIWGMASYVIRLDKIIRQIEGEKIIFLYPTNYITMDIMCLMLFKVLRKYKIYYEVNELRRSVLFNKSFSRNPFKGLYQVIHWCVDYVKSILLEMLTRYYDGLIVISTTIERHFKRYNNNMLRVPILSDTLEKKFSGIPHFINGARFQICYSGSICLKREGFDLLFKALAQVKCKIRNFELHLYGPVTEEKLLLIDLPLLYGIEENIFYHGVVEQRDLLGEMQKHHLLISPRPLNLQTKYGFSTKLSEYLISGVPILITDVSDNGLYIKDGVNGFIVKPGDVNEMAEKILYIIEQYNSIADGVALKGFNTAMQYFHYGNFKDQLTNFLH